LDKEKGMTKGEKVKALMDDLNIRDFVVLASTPKEEGEGFSLAMGESEMLISLYVMFFRQYPELWVMITATIARIFAGVTDEQLRENQEAMEAAQTCDCPNCGEGEDKAKGGDVDLNDFIASGKLKH
jgi:hypothetical protein